MSRRTSDSEERELLIDTAAAAELPTDDEIREWARTKRVFISSVMSELKQERATAAKAIEAFGAQPVMFENFGGRDQDPENAYLSEVESSDIYVGIIGQRYGKMLPSRYSATHTEYLHAEINGLRVAVWTALENERDGREHAFIEEVRAFHVASTFQSMLDLEVQITRRLRELAAEDLSPWCQLGNVIFRARTVRDRGEEIVVEARVRNDAVAHALEGMRNDKWGHGFEGQFTWAGRSAAAKVTNVEVITSTARSKIVKMPLERRDARSNRLEMSMGGRTADDLVELDVRCGIFGEPNPLNDPWMFQMMEDPFTPIRNRSLPDESLRQIAEVLFTEAMVGSGRAGRVTEFRMGTSIAGIRRLAVGWETPRRYSNVATERRRVEGQVLLS